MKSAIIKASFLLTGILLSIFTWAQDTDKKLDVDIDVNKGDSQWYTQPWVWVVGVAVFILLLAAILKSGGKKE